MVTLFQSLILLTAFGTSVPGVPTGSESRSERERTRTSRADRAPPRNRYRHTGVPGYSPWGHASVAPRGVKEYTAQTERGVPEKRTTLVRGYRMVAIFHRPPLAHAERRRRRPNTALRPALSSPIPNSDGRRDSRPCSRCSRRRLARREGVVVNGEQRDALPTRSTRRQSRERPCHRGDEANVSLSDGNTETSPVGRPGESSEPGWRSVPSIRRLSVQRHLFETGARTLSDDGENQ